MQNGAVDNVVESVENSFCTIGGKVIDMVEKSGISILFVKPAGKRNAP